MNSFFYSSDYDLFRKALRNTKNEPVVINILSDDSSLRDDDSDGASSTVIRKQASAKFQASPFDKFFGPRKKRTDPLDMKDFSSWKNKNYRESEKNIDFENDEAKSFSFSDYLNSKAKNDRYNDEDKVKSEIQKPIEQISVNDESYKKFSLDSYLNKLEQERKARKEFIDNEDLIEIDESHKMIGEELGNQDENFGSVSDLNIEDFTNDENVAGDHFAIDREELDSVRARLDKKEREENNIKDKPTSKVISVDEINEIKGTSEDEDDEFNLDKLGIEDDIERVNSKIDSLNKILQVTGDDETTTPKVEHKKFMEINKNFDEKEENADGEVLESIDVSTDGDEINENVSEESQQSNADDGIVGSTEIDGAVNTDNLDEETQDESGDVVDVVEMPEAIVDEERKSEINRTDYLTRADFKDFTEEIVNKFSEMYRDSALRSDRSVAGVDEIGTQGINEEYVGQEISPNFDQDVINKQTDLQAKIVELIEQNKKSDMEIAEKLRLAEQETERVQKEYEEKLRELRTSMEQRDEEAKQQAYIEKLKNDIKFKKSENDFKLREEEIRESEKISSEKQFAGEKLKTELKNNLSVSNLEMDKKLLESAAKLHASLGLNVDTEIDDVQEESISEPLEAPDKKRTTTRQRARNRSTRTTRRRTSTVNSRMRTRTPRRKIDSDIIGGIDFD